MPTANEIRKGNWIADLLIAAGYTLGGGGGGGAQLVANETSPTGNVLVVTGLTETIVPGCDLTAPGSPGLVLVNYTIWISQNRNGVAKQATLRLRRTNAAGAVLSSLVVGDSGDSTSGHQVSWSGAFVDTVPTDGRYVITVQETAGDGATEIWSDTRLFYLLSQ